MNVSSQDQIRLLKINTMFALHILGISPISFYLVDILQRGHVALDSEWSAVGVGVIETIGMLVKYMLYKFDSISLIIVSV